MNANAVKKNANDPPADLRGQKPDEQKGAVEGDHRLDKEPGNKNAVARSTKTGFRRTRKPLRKIPSARERTKPKDETQLAPKVPGQGDV